MKNNKENILMDREKQFTPLEREVSPENAFIKGSVFAMLERKGKKKASTKLSKTKNKQK